MHVLLTNDDGIRSLGLRSLYCALLENGVQVSVVAPLTEQSAVGHAVTLSSPLRVKKIAEDGFQGHGILGTPVDCVKIAINSILKTRPDLVISGINNGANVGVDILYSGTVAAATEAALAGIPALAVSIDDFHPHNLTEQSCFVSRLINHVPWPALPKGCVLNLNFPAPSWIENKGLRLCPQTQAVYKDHYEQRIDPRGNEYFWLCGEIPKQDVRPGTDRDLLSQGFITLTPLKFEFTARELLRQGPLGKLEQTLSTQKQRRSKPPVHNHASPHTPEKNPDR